MCVCIHIYIYIHVYDEQGAVGWVGSVRSQGLFDKNDDDDDTTTTTNNNNNNNENDNNNGNDDNKHDTYTIHYRNSYTTNRCLQCLINIMYNSIRNNWCICMNISCG